MNYEIVTLAEKTVAGYSAPTNNASPDMGKIIGGLWEKFYGPNGYPSIANIVNGKAYGIYTDYATDETGDYTAMAACEVATENVPEHLETRKLPAGKYAKFIVKGNMHTAVAEFWAELWQMNLNRAFICDFEEYQNSDCENAEIHIYISLK